MSQSLYVFMFTTCPSLVFLFIVPVSVFLQPVLVAVSKECKSLVLVSVLILSSDTCIYNDVLSYSILDWPYSHEASFLSQSF